jgi:cytochrome c biogenesis protein
MNEAPDLTDKGDLRATDAASEEPAKPMVVTPSLLPASQGGQGSSEVAGSNFAKVAWRRLLRELSSLPRAISIMATIAILSGLGTIIPQNKARPCTPLPSAFACGRPSSPSPPWAHACMHTQAIEFYVENYPEEGSKVLGFLSYPILLGLQLDHIYSAWYFYAALFTLAASLAACTFTTQLPVAKVR